MKGFGPRFSETAAVSFGKSVTAPERHFVPESSASWRKDNRKVML
jgi:hypothetical protein